MSAIQSKIPFKSRKKTGLYKKKLNQDENEDVLNIMTSKNELKRGIEDNSLNKFDDDACTATKISRPDILNDHKTSVENNSGKIIMKPLTSREKEIEFIETFLTEHLDNEESASLYVSGQPGTGKTATLTYLLQLPKIKLGYKQVYINCTMMKTAASIYNRICKELHLQTTSSTEKACLNAIENYFNTKHKMTLLVLDEVDQLDGKRQSVLYSIFEWPSLARSRLVLVGVANALDLPTRALPRLRARPNTVHFAPYTKQQIVDIFTSVLADQDKTHLFSPVALQMLAAKIAAISGDMRRALDIGQRVIELAKRSKFAENKSVDCMMKDATATVELKQVLEVLNNVYGGNKEIETQIDEGLPMQQKLILCSLLLMLKKGKNKVIMFGKLYDVYKKVSSARNLLALEAGDVWGACALLEARGALRVAGGAPCGGGGARSRRLRLHWDETELTAALRDKPLLSAILRDTDSLPADL